MKKKKKASYVKIQYPVGCILQRIIIHVYGDRGFVLPNIEEILYDNAIVSDLLTMDMVLSNGHKRDIVSKFITAFSDIRLSKPVSWLFKYRIENTFPIDGSKEKQPVDEVFVNIIKEIIWVTYYFSTKPPGRLIIVGSPQDILSRLQGIYLDGLHPMKMYDISRDKYIENILSLKDRRYGFLPHPEHIDPDDLERVLVENNAITKELFERVRDLYNTIYTPDERYQTFAEVREAIIARIEEVNDVKIT